MKGYYESNGPALNKLCFEKIRSVGERYVRFFCSEDKNLSYLICHDDELNILLIVRKGFLTYQGKDHSRMNNIHGG